MNCSASRSGGAQIRAAHGASLRAEQAVGRLLRSLFSRDGKWLVTGGGGNRIWEVGTWREGPALGGLIHRHGFTFAADGKLLALGDATGVGRLVVPDTGREVARLTAPEQTRLRPWCFTPDGTRLVTQGSETQALHIFDLRAIREQLAELGLDWDAPPLPPAPPIAAEPPGSSRRSSQDGGDKPRRSPG
jgi:hypothetical protein